MILSAADSLTLADGALHPTGFWAEEVVVAHRDLVAAGHEVVIATPGGVPPTVDPGSVTPQQAGSAERAAEFVAYLGILPLENPVDLGDVDVTDYGALVLPGGHGPMVDLASDATLGTLLTSADAAGILIAPFCHGPAALLSAISADGSFVFAGRTLAVFTDEEELAGGLGNSAPWLVASTLAERGAVLDSGPAWSSHVVRDGNLISGQNPQSSAGVALTLIEALA